MVVEQLDSNGDGYSKPERGFIAPISYDFKVTVNPCEVTSLPTSPSEAQDVEY